MTHTIAHARQRGFSLIEILVVLVIIGLLVSIVAPNVMDRADSARIQKVEADFNSIQTALKLYRLDNYMYPNSQQGLEALVSRPTSEPVPRNWRRGGYLDSLPRDPWGNPYGYESPAGDREYDIYTLGADGTPGGDGQNADISVWDDLEQFE
ncbi:type II secretion system major pseudopilin GspG [Marinimicrobium alkaliphilum]|uniref:type II secretion system major pseudopilin GspG n=1 Tax=Marinimicrobium alkaliphilum TaxID=2202654 RepID=UPI000DB9DF37|nr:type II secretion system major pseudopilin GspG [Marinimicrobium alkaliphilum]